MFKKVNTPVLGVIENMSGFLLSGSTSNPNSEIQINNEVLEIDEAVRHWKAKGLDLAPILTPAEGPHPDTVTTCTISQNHALIN